MVETRLVPHNLSVESQQVLELIKAKKHFLLSGGAGSGKTYSLVETLNAVTHEFPALNIACITYTNAAVDEIEERISHEHLYVSTIHDFLWDNIKKFQTELKETLIELINDVDVNKINLPDKAPAEPSLFDDVQIQYREYLKLRTGVISHDEVILLASKMYEKYEKLCSITKDKYPFIFVDEYQDTDPLVVKILLDDLAQSSKKNVVGFFGDAMQSIYNGSIGNLDEYTRGQPPIVEEVLKEQNRRNPSSVIDLANQLRTDSVTQEPSDDPKAPNMDEFGNVKLGDIKFLYSQNDDVESVRRYLGWDFSDTGKVKELNLTHNLIAKQAEFPELMRVYDKDKVLEFVKKQVKKYLYENASGLNTSELTLRDILEAYPDINATKTQQEYIDEYSDIYEIAQDQPYEVISRLYIDKEQLLDDKKNYVGDENRPNSQRDDLIKHLFKIEKCIRLYQDQQFNQFMKITDFKIRSVEDKQKLNEAIIELLGSGKTLIGEVIDLAHELKIVLKDDRYRRFIREKEYIYKQVSEIRYQEFRNVYNYLEGYTPFSTQHKTKGTEFSNVLVVLDNGKWNQYNFKYLFEKTGNENVRERTNKIFYVCCTRAKENLAVFFHSPSQAVLQTAKEWFGEENVVNLDGNS